MLAEWRHVRRGHVVLRRREAVGVVAFIPIVVRHQEVPVQSMVRVCDCKCEKNCSLIHRHSLSTSWVLGSISWRPPASGGVSLTAIKICELEASSIYVGSRQTWPPAVRPLALCAANGVTLRRAAYPDIVHVLYRLDLTPATFHSQHFMLKTHDHVTLRLLNLTIWVVYRPTNVDLTHICATGWERWGFLSFGG